MFSDFVKKLLGLLGYACTLGIIAIFILSAEFNNAHSMRLKIMLFALAFLPLSAFFTWIMTSEKKNAKTLSTIFTVLSSIVLMYSLVFMYIYRKNDHLVRIESAFCTSTLKHSNPTTDIYTEKQATADLSELKARELWESEHPSPSKPQQTTIQNFKINYVNSSRWLKIQMDELFTLQPYYFKAETDTPCIVDCGTNIGLSIVFFKMIYPKAKIIGFEPDEKTFSVLEQNIHDNNFTNVTVYNKALLNKKGHISFFYDNDDSSIGSILGADSRKPNPLEKIVEADTLSSYINQPVDFLKMDVEGAETEIFEDLHKNNKLHFIKNIVMEFHHNISNSRNNLIKLLTILEQNNFGYIIENLNTLNAPQKLDPEKKNKLQGLFICACQNS